MENDINNLDPDDIGLKSIFGDNWRDSTKEEHKPQPKPKPVRSHPMEAQYEPVTTGTPLDKLVDCVKWVLPFGGLSCLIFYWQQAGLMAPSIAVPSMCVCTLLVGLGVGKNVYR